MKFLLTGIIILATSSYSLGRSIEVEEWIPPFNRELRKIVNSYSFLLSAEKKWRICVSIPHLKDAYWSAVNYGLIQEARQKGIALDLFEAGGYNNLDVQRKQLKNCLKEKYDGVIISAIKFDGVNDLVSEFKAQGIPVIDLINGLDSRDINARVGASYYDMAYQTGVYLKSKVLGSKVRVLWMPGPKDASWVDAGNRGFLEGVSNSSIEIVATLYGDTGRTAQGRLIRSFLSENHDIDFIVGTSVTAEAAVDIVRRKNINAKIMSYYYSPGVHRGIKRGQIISSPTDKQAVAARLAVDILIKVLEKRPYPKHIGPRVQVVDQNNITDFDPSTSVSPKGFRTVFSVN